MEQQSMLDFTEHQDTFLKNKEKLKPSKLKKMTRFIVKVCRSKVKNNRFFIKVWDNKRGREVCRAELGKNKLQKRFDDIVKCYKLACEFNSKVLVIDEENLIHG